MTITKVAQLPLLYMHLGIVFKWRVRNYCNEFYITKIVYHNCNVTQQRWVT